MNKKNYTVYRNSIFVGKVVKASSIYRLDSEFRFFKTEPGQLLANPYIPYRSMLFVPNEDQMAQDLLYNSPCYPILNISNDEKCLSLGDDSVVVEDSCNLEQLLEYFGYAKELTLEDIIKIRKTFFTGRFAKDNCELFGLRESNPEDWTFYENGKILTDEKKIQKRIAKIKASGERSFSGVFDSVLQKEYFDVLDTMGDETLSCKVLKSKFKIDSFAPHKEEGFVKKLSRF